MDLSLSKLQEMVKDRGADVPQSMGLQRLGHNWVTEQQQQWISLEVDLFFSLKPSEETQPSWHLDFRFWGSKHRNKSNVTQTFNLRIVN